MRLAQARPNNVVGVSFLTNYLREVLHTSLPMSIAHVQCLIEFVCTTVAFRFWLRSTWVAKLLALLSCVVKLAVAIWELHMHSYCYGWKHE